jgi:uncharacterized membrane protein
MLNIISAIFFSSCIILTFRLFTICKIDNLQAITTNYLVACLLSFFLYNGSLSAGDVIEAPWFGWAVVNGFLFILVFYIFAHSAQKVGVAITAVSSKMSVIIPVSLGFLFYNESINLGKIMGLLFALPAFYLIFSSGRKIRTPLRYTFLPIILFIGTGTNDSVMKHAQLYYKGNENLLYLGVVFAIAFLIGAIIFLKALWKKRSVSGRSVLAGFILGTFNFLSTYFFLRSLELFDNSVFFPVFNVSVVSMGALIGYAGFKEKLMNRNWIGIALAICTITLIALS